MGAAAAKLGGFGQMKDDIEELKKHMQMIEGIAGKLQETGKTITDQADGAMKAKAEIEQKLGGISGKIDQVKQLSNGIGPKISTVENLIKSLSGGR